MMLYEPTAHREPELAEMHEPVQEEVTELTITPELIMRNLRTFLMWI